MRKAAAVVIPVLAILSSVLASPPAAVAAPDCHCCWDQAPFEICESEADALITQRLQCQQQVDETFTRCTNRCKPVVPGRCGYIRGCLDGCRAARRAQRGKCWTLYKKQLRGTCRSGFAQAKIDRRRCRRRQLTCECPDITIPTTTTVSTSTTATTATTTTTTTTLAGSGSAADLTGDPAARRGCFCQSNCIADIVGRCFEQCKSSCGVDFQARDLCDQLCRDAQCAVLNRACTDANTSPESGDYRACCAACDNCKSDLDCEVTTTTSTTTSSTTTVETTTSTTTTTTTTTLIFR